MRTHATALLALLLLAATLTGCGIGPRIGESAAEFKSDDRITLTIMHNWTIQDGKAIAYRRIMEEFRASHPNVILEEEGLATDSLKSKIRTLAAADEMPDLFVMWPYAMTGDFVRGDLIQPIDDFLNSRPEWKNGFIPHAFDDFTVNGRIYTVPMNLAPTSLIYYNQELFDRYAVKVPTTWDELLIAVDVFNRNEIIPIALGNKANWVAQSTIFSTIANRVTGTEWFLNAVNQTGASFEDPVFIEALSKLQQLAQAHAFQTGFNSIDDNQMMKLYFEGKAAMFINGGWAVSNIVNNAPQEVLDHTHVTILPPIEGGKGEERSTSGVVGTGLGVNKKLTGAKKEAALDLLYALSGPEGQKATLDSSTLVSYNIEPDPTIAHPLFIELDQLIAGLDIHPVYDISLSSAAAEVVNNSIQELLSGGSPEDAARKIQRAQAAAVNNG